MTEDEQIILVKAMTGETDESTISAFLALAGQAIVSYADPYGNADRGLLLSRYSGTQAKAAAYYLNKRGAEGQLTHNENGISRSYESGDLPTSLLREITPLCGVTT